MVGERNEDGFSALTLESEALGGIEAIFVPEAGMVCCSLRHRGEELLGQRGGLNKYVESGSTMGIPFLHPWANRLGRSRFEVCGREVNLDLPDLRVKRDAAGLPMHGLLTAAGGWRVERHGEVDGGGVLTASFDFGAYPRLTAAFPFPHRVELEATLGGPALTIVTTLRNDGDVGLPVSFGFHPYLRLPGVERGEWGLEAPARERLELGPDQLPTGRRELRMGEGYRFAQIFTPGDCDAVAFEPMTAPTNALVTGGPDLPLVAPGESFSATFSIAVG